MTTEAPRWYRAVVDYACDNGNRIVHLEEHPIGDAEPAALPGKEKSFVFQACGMQAALTQLTNAYIDYAGPAAAVDPVVGIGAVYDDDSMDLEVTWASGKRRAVFIPGAHAQITQREIAAAKGRMRKD